MRSKYLQFWNEVIVNVSVRKFSDEHEAKRRWTNKVYLSECLESQIGELVASGHFECIQIVIVLSERC